LRLHSSSNPMVSSTVVIMMMVIFNRIIIRVSKTRWISFRLRGLLRIPGPFGTASYQQNGSWATCHKAMHSTQLFVSTQTAVLGLLLALAP
jgi:hypothetical protein